jgi:hypothetical protein
MPLKAENGVRWVRSLFAWKHVRQDKVWIYFENSVTGQRRCRWRGDGYAPVDYRFIRPGDIIEGPFRREVLSYDTFASAS